MKISVITTVYNVEKYIEKTITSVLEQTFQDWELILVNDKSTDNSLEKIKQFNDNRIKIVNNEENLGAGKSRQVGIDNAEGEYIIFLDGDDWLNSECLEKMYNAAIENDADIVNCKVQTANGESTIKFKAIDERFYNLLTNKLIKKTLFEKTHYSPLRLFEDVNTLYRLLHWSKKNVKIDYIGYVYNIRPNSLSNNNIFFYMNIFEALSIMENVDYFEGMEFNYRHKYNAALVIKLYHSRIKNINENLKKSMIDEIETIRLWCDDKQNKIFKKIISNFMSK